MKILELFAGSRSIGSVAQKRGHEVFSVDIEAFEGIDLVKDIHNLLPTDVPFVPDMVWSGTPCETYSLAAGSHHRYPMYKPKTEFAIKCDQMNINVNMLIKHWMYINPELIYYIENPRGMLRKMEFMKGIPRVTIWYCTYGDFRAKPTDIFSNNIYNPMFNPLGWQPRPECHNGNIKCHHESAPRGSRTGTQGMNSYYEKSKYPPELCEEIIIHTERKINYLYGINNESN